MVNPPTPFAKGDGAASKPIAGTNLYAKKIFFAFKNVQCDDSPFIKGG